MRWQHLKHGVGARALVVGLRLPGRSCRRGGLNEGKHVLGGTANLLRQAYDLWGRRIQNLNGIDQIIKRSNHEETLKNLSNLKIK